MPDFGLIAGIAGWVLALAFFLLWKWETRKRQVTEKQIAELRARLAMVQEAMSNG